MPKVSINASVDAALAESLHASARAANRTFSAEVCRAIEMYLAAQSVGPFAPQKGIAERAMELLHARQVAERETPTG